MAAVAAPDTETIYSDLNYIILGWAIAALDGDLATSLTQHLFAPLGMHATGYRPQHVAAADFVPTENVRDDQINPVDSEHSAIWQSLRSGIFACLSWK